MDRLHDLENQLEQSMQKKVRPRHQVLVLFLLITYAIIINHDEL